MKIQLCKDSEGFVWAVALPDNAKECESGPILGPPTGLTKQVHNRFAEAGIYNAFDLLNTPRREWLKLLDDANTPRTYARTLVHLYQRDYFEKDE